MDFTKIKDFLLEKKNYLIIIAIVVGLFWWSKQGSSNRQVDTAKVTTEDSALVTAKKKEDIPNKPAASRTVTCDISGAVKHQGVYTLKNGARLDELIAAAGGTRKNVQLKAINRALILKDQDKIHIPYKGEKVTPAATVGTSGTAGSASTDASNTNSGEKINLNTASAADLQKLNGIGEKKAEKIIEYREKNGQFKKIEDLKQVSGIGDKTFATLKDHLEV
ncbi:helix-hairpin-helix domain-containing protein [Lactobacillus sp. ESL0791]|uniref:helix-hairpin-helix domain-containing protein n=1 Tax=Lactobacillus sp. ESL0791 TaxID=2983234 RepID=UPI0023F97FFF|nr:helix-hairpin-helix domain-containing protein [Lactobacillus sp. ESL0791]MDF7638840.1 helix-hairpin-helix domain-containing protein [Lactobacillus sp. ESL0791]